MTTHGCTLSLIDPQHPRERQLFRGRPRSSQPPRESHIPAFHWYFPNLLTTRKFHFRCLQHGMRLIIGASQEGLDAPGPIFFCPVGPSAWLAPFSSGQALLDVYGAVVRS
jgi:hypothetical protein